MLVVGYPEVCRGPMPLSMSFLILAKDPKHSDHDLYRAITKSLQRTTLFI